MHRPSILSKPPPRAAARWSRRQWLIAAAAVVGAAPAHARPTVVHLVDARSPQQGGYHLWLPEKAARTLVLLLPPYGGGADYYDDSRLPGLLTAQGLAFAVLHAGPVGFLEPGDITRLDALVAHVLQRSSVDRRQVAIGGFSAGGTGALRYTVLALAGQTPLAVRPRAAFSVDAPLDLERWYRGMDSHLRRLGPQASGAFAGESRFLVGHLQRLMGGTPDEKPEIYRERSVLSLALPDGGHARHLKDLPLRLYSEPDMAFYIEHGLDYGSINAYDQVALASLLRAQGSRQVSLVLTSGRGYRADLGGVRLPHAWSIVDEAELADWLLKHLGV